MVFIVDSRSRRRFQDAIEQMHQTRRKVFVERLNWKLRVDEAGREIDEFDTADADYMMDIDPDSGCLLGSLRLLPTDRAHLLSVHFADLCETAIPRGEDVREISRLVTAPDLPRDRCMRVRHRLASALMEYGLMIGLRSYTLVTHTSWLPTLLCVGWTCRPLGLPADKDQQSIGAMAIEVSQAGLTAIRSFGGRYPVLSAPPRTLQPQAEKEVSYGL